MIARTEGREAKGARTAIGFSIAVAASIAAVGALAPGVTRAGTAPATFVVNRSSDQPDANLGNSACDTDLATSGDQCTLRAALEQANTTIDQDTITFKIPGPGVHTIAPSSDLPAISKPVVIDGYTQPGASPNTRRLRRGDNAELRIALSGKRLDPNFSIGLDLAGGSSGSVVEGLVINRFGGGIVIRADATVRGCFIGTNAAGTKARRNKFDGIFSPNFPLSPVARIGGPRRADRNLISGNGNSAITSDRALIVQGNLIGVASDGHSPLGNKVTDVFGAAHDAAVGLYGGFSTVGGPGEAANVIAFNEGKGVSVVNPGTTGWITRTRIYGNGGLAIDLGDNGRTANDAGDGDTGPNGLLNFPLLSRAIAHPRGTRVKGLLRTFPAEAPYGIELFANPPHGRQARRLVGSIHLTTNASGVARFAAKVKRVGPGRTITATAIDDGGETSELSAPVRVRRP